MFCFTYSAPTLVEFGPPAQTWSISFSINLSTFYIVEKFVWFSRRSTLYAYDEDNGEDDGDEDVDDGGGGRDGCHVDGHDVVPVIIAMVCVCNLRAQYYYSSYFESMLSIAPVGLLCFGLEHDDHSH